MTSDFPCQFWWDQHFRTQQYEEHLSPFKIKKNWQYTKLTIIGLSAMTLKKYKMAFYNKRFFQRVLQITF